MYCLTLVHGTFARWSYRWPYLERRLREEFGEELILEYTRWSGRNSLGGRRRAAERLQRDLRFRIEKFPSAKHFIVAHSHGGNVAMMALHDPKLCARISGACTLATPFLRADRRSLSFYDGILVALAILFSMFYLTMVPVFLLDSMMEIGADTAPWLVLPALAVGFFGFLALFFVVFDAAETAQSDTRVPPLRQDRLLIIRAPGDEAVGFITFFGFVSWLLKAANVVIRIPVWCGVWVTTRLVERRLKDFIQLAAAVALYSTLVMNWTPHGLTEGVTSWPLRFFLVSLLSLFLGPAALMYAGALFAAFNWIAAIALAIVPFGVRLALAVPWLDITVEATPPGTWTVHQLKRENTRAALMHSTPYEHPRSINLIVCWMRERALDGSPNASGDQLV